MQKYRIEIKWAFIFIAMMILWMIGERVSGVHGEYIEYHPIVTNLIAIPAILIYVFALRDKRDSFFGGSMTWKQGFMAGAIITAIVTLVSPLTQYLTSTVISPNYFANAIEYSVASGGATQAEAEAFFNLKSFLIMAPIGSVIMGLVTSAIVAIFVKRSK